MGKSFLIAIILTSIVLADTTDSSLQNISTVIEPNVSDSNSTPLKVEITNKDSFWETLGITFISLLGATLIGGGILWLVQKVTLEKHYRRESFENHFFNLLQHQYNILNNIRIKFRITYHDYKTYGSRSPAESETVVNTAEDIQFFSLMKKYLNLLYEYQMTYSQTHKISLKAKLKEENLITSEEIEEFYNDSPVRKFNSKSEYEDNLELLKEFSLYTYDFIYRKYYDYLGHYFRHLFNILKYIESKEKEIKKFGGDVGIYAGLIQARMSFSELHVLFYDGLFFDNMETKIDKYCLIENLAPEDLMNEKHQAFYKCKMKPKQRYIPLKIISDKNG